jgi:hypothetical protein
VTASARVSTPFGQDSTAAEVIAGVDLSGKSALVTGAGSRIGVETTAPSVSAPTHQDTYSLNEDNEMTEPTSLEARIQHLEDIEEITTLTATYGRYVNKGWNGEVVELDKLPEVFTADARWQADAMNADVTGIDNIIFGALRNI